MATVPQQKDRTEDLAEVRSREWLIVHGLTAMTSGKIDDAMDYFGAAIRKSRKQRYWDVEVEYYRFQTLSRAGDYDKAVQRCVICLDALHETRIQHKDKDLPWDYVQEHLESALLITMALRGDGFMQRQNHLRKKHLGEYYLLKQPRPMMTAIRIAWSTGSSSQIPPLDEIRQQLRMISVVILGNIIDEVMGITSETAGSSEVAAGEGAGSAGTAPESTAPAASVEVRKDLPDLIARLLRRESHSLSSEEERLLCRFVSACNNPEAIELLSNFLENASEQIRLPYLKALSINPKSGQILGSSKRIRKWLNAAMEKGELR